jgi:hypothetical protein
MLQRTGFRGGRLLFHVCSIARARYAASPSIPRARFAGLPSIDMTGIKHRPT